MTRLGKGRFRINSKARRMLLRINCISRLWLDILSFRMIMLWKGHLRRMLSKLLIWISLRIINLQVRIKISFNIGKGHLSFRVVWTKSVNPPKNANPKIQRTPNQVSWTIFQCPYRNWNQLMKKEIVNKHHNKERLVNKKWSKLKKSESSLKSNLLKNSVSKEGNR